MAKDLLRRTVTENPFIPKYGGQFPSAPQAVFLTVPVLEILYGGAAGSGKSGGILAGALQYVSEPGYDALIVRRSYADLEKPGGLIPLSKQWLLSTSADYNEQTHRWTFPSGATLSFGHVQNDTSVVQDYQGSAFAYIGFDELTQFTEFMYRYLFSRLRKTVGLRFPSRMRATSNPGGVGHEWVKKRFIDASDGIKRLFIPAKLEDNPGLNREEYEESLDQLDAVTRAQLRHGDWDIRPEGNLFKRAWFEGKFIRPDQVPALRRTIRYWDLAATKKTDAAKVSSDPDYAVGCKAGQAQDGSIYILDARRFRDTPKKTNANLLKTAENDGVEVSVRIEQEPGASSKLYIDGIAQQMAAYDVRGVASLTDKLTRARPASAACERGDVYFVRGPWVETFLDELCAFPIVAHDDQVDAFTGAYNELTNELRPWNEEDLQKVFGKREKKEKSPYELLREKLLAGRRN